MARKKTVLVLGAGASEFCGYPLGRDLHKEVRSAIEDHAFFETLARTQHNIGPEHARKFYDIFKKLGAQTIDEFLSLRSDFQDIGRIIIGYALARIEARKEHEDKLTLPDTSWYPALKKLIIPNSSLKLGTIPNLAESNLSIITFNYDRSLKHSLMTMLEAATGLSTKQLSAAVEQIKIVHIHGKIGPLSWEYPETIIHPIWGPMERSRRRYGQLDFINDPELVEIFATDCLVNIRILNDPNHKQTVEAAAKLVTEAEAIFFLGFGYHESNLKLLGGGWNKKENGRIVRGSCIGMNENDRAAVERTLCGNDCAFEFIRGNRTLVGLLQDYIPSQIG